MDLRKFEKRDLIDYARDKRIASEANNCARLSRETEARARKLKRVSQQELIFQSMKMQHI